MAHEHGSSPQIAKSTRQRTEPTRAARLAFVANLHPLATLAILALLAPTTLLSSGCSVDMVEITSGFAILPLARPALANNGTVVAATASELIAGDGGATTTIDLTAADLSFSAVTGRKRIQVGDTGDLVFIATRGGTMMGCPLFIGVYETNSGGASITTAHETCPSVSPGPSVGASLGMSTNGTVAFSDIRNGQGAIYRYPFGTSPLVLRTGTGEFYNFGGLDVNDAGQVPIQMEYFDGFSGGLSRGVLVFETFEQAKLDTDTAIEKLSVGVQPRLAVNDSGTVALSTNIALAFSLEGVMYSFPPGIYTATPTLFNSAKMLVPVATFTDGYCRFGAVDINDAGTVIFEALVGPDPVCGAGTGYGGLYNGADPVTDVVVEYGDARLADHQFFDSVYLGEINDSAQVSFITTYSEPLVPPVTVWRYDP